MVIKFSKPGNSLLAELSTGIGKKKYFLGCMTLIRQEMIHFSNTYCFFEAMPPRGLPEGGLPPRGQPVLLVANLKGVARNELVRSDNSDNLRGV